MAIGWENFCKGCGCMVRRGLDMCIDCANSEKPGRSRGSKVALSISLLLVAALMATSYAQVTWEQAKARACAMGVACDMESIIQFYYDQLNAMQNQQSTEPPEQIEEPGDNKDPRILSITRTASKQSTEPPEQIEEPGDNKDPRILSITRTASKIGRYFKVVSENVYQG